MALRNPQLVDYALVLYGPARIHESLNGAEVGFLTSAFHQSWVPLQCFSFVMEPECAWILTREALCFIKFPCLYFVRKRDAFRSITPLPDS
jgi:hypothetical protein